MHETTWQKRAVQTICRELSPAAILVFEKLMEELEGGHLVVVPEDTDARNNYSIPVEVGSQELYLGKTKKVVWGGFEIAKPGRSEAEIAEWNQPFEPDLAAVAAAKLKLILDLEELSGYVRRRGLNSKQIEDWDHLLGQVSVAVIQEAVKRYRQTVGKWPVHIGRFSGVLGQVVRDSQETQIPMLAAEEAPNMGQVDLAKAKRSLVLDLRPEQRPRLSGFTTWEEENWDDLLSRYSFKEVRIAADAYRAGGHEWPIDIVFFGRLLDAAAADVAKRDAEFGAPEEAKTDFEAAMFGAAQEGFDRVKDALIEGTWSGTVPATEVVAFDEVFTCPLTYTYEKSDGEEIPIGEAPVNIDGAEASFGETVNAEGVEDSPEVIPSTLTDLATELEVVIPSPTEDVKEEKPDPKECLGEAPCGDLPESFRPYCRFRLIERPIGMAWEDWLKASVASVPALPDNWEGVSWSLITPTTFADMVTDCDMTTPEASAKILRLPIDLVRSVWPSAKEFNEQTIGFSIGELGVFRRVLRNRLEVAK